MRRGYWVKLNFLFLLCLTSLTTPAVWGQETEGLLSYLTRVVERKVSLPPQEMMSIPIPLWWTGTRVEVSFIPDSLQHPTKAGSTQWLPKAKPLTSTDLNTLIQQRIAKQNKDKMASISVSLSIGGGTVAPLKNDTDENDFVFDVEPAGFSANAIVRNVSTQRVQGLLQVTSIDARQDLLRQRQNRQKRLEATISAYPSPDLLLALNHTFKRHLKGYPGGKSTLENKLSSKLLQAKISTKTIQQLSNNLDRFRTRLELDPRLRDINLSRRTIQESIDANRIEQDVQNVFNDMSKVIPYVILFENDGFKGRSMKVPASGKFDNLNSENFNDVASSVRIWGGKWQLCEHANYQGSCLVLTGDAPTLVPRGWHNKISSIRPLPNGPTQGLTIYEHAGYGGRSAVVTQTIRNLEKQAFNDEISSVRVGKGRWQLCEHADFKGKCFLVESDISTLVPLDWNDRISSIQEVPAEGLNKYSIRLVGVRSENCRPDSKRRQKCDPQEPFVVWSAFSPNYQRSGVTDWKKDAVTPDEEFYFSEDTNVYSRSQNSTEPIPVHPPLFFIYQVIEKDKGGPSREEWVELAITGTQLVANLASQNWVNAGKDGVILLINTFDVLIKLKSDGDDEFPALISAFDEEFLFTLTSGSESSLLGKTLFESEGNYQGYSIQIHTVPEREPDKYEPNAWKVLFFVTREEVS